MVSLTGLVKANDLTIKQLEAKLKKAEEQLAAVKELEDKLKASKSMTGSSKGSALKEINKGLQELRAPAVFPKSATAEMEAADRLAVSLEKGGLRLKKRLPSIAREAMAKPGATVNDLRNALVDAVVRESGAMAPDMARFLGASLGESFGRFADPEWGILYGSADDLLEKIVLHGADYATEYSGQLSRFVLNQVDRTQKASRFSFTRHVEANACSWCKAQVQVFEITGEFQRHANCRCMRVRR